MNKLWITVFVMIGFSGCAWLSPKNDAPITNSRIVYRDLTVDQVKPDQPKPPEEYHSSTYYIEFENESQTRFDEAAFMKFLQNVDKSANIIILGHSHGNSNKGTLTLSSGRSRTIRDLMVKNGYENVHVMAFWSRKAVSFAPVKGVDVYVMDSVDTLSEVALIIKKNEGAENEKFDPNQPVGGVDHHGGSYACTKNNVLR